MLLRLCLPWSLGRCLGALALALTLPTAVLGQAPSVAGTLPEDYLPGLRALIDSGLKQSPEMIVRELNIAVADAQRIENGLSPLLPRLSGNLYYGAYQTSVANNSGANSRNNGLFGGATLSQNIFQWGALTNQLEVQKVAQQMAQKNYAEGYRGFVSTLRRQYLALIVAKITARNTRFSLEVSRKALAVANEKLKSGSIAPTEMLGPRLDVERLELATDRSTQAYEAARRALAHQAGLKDIADEAVPLEIPAPTYPADAASALADEFIKDGARGTYLEQLGELNVRQWDLRYRIAKVRLLPQISADASISQQNQTNASPASGSSPASVSQTSLTTESYSVNAQWNVFDGLATRGAKLEALSNRRIAEKQLEKQVDELIGLAQSLRHSSEFAWRALHISDTEWSSTEGALKYAKTELGLGNLSQDAVDGAQNSLNANDAARAAARADFLSTWSDYVSLVGADPAMNNLPNRYARPSP